MSLTAAPSAWSAYAPTKDTPWDLRRVVHLHRRAGFAASWGEIQRDLADGPDKSVERVLAGKARLSGVPEEFESFSATLADNADEGGRLKAWWVYRMLFGPDPLAERLTLTWHNHFATSGDKVRERGLMRAQNETLRKYHRAKFATLLGAVVKDPAMLHWLDAPSNRKGQPNENLARELMELFSMGVGTFSEADVKDGARALTGWTVTENKFREDKGRHDDGDKVILGHKGKWKGDDLVRFVLARPETASRLAFRLGEVFFGEAMTLSLRAGLADVLRKNDLDIAATVGVVLRSQAFFADDVIGRRVLGPIEYAVGAAQALEMGDSPPSTMLLADWSARLGMDLFFPPNVGGWKGGRDWLSPQTMIGRANFAAALVKGTVMTQPAPFDALGLARKYGRGETLDGVVTFYAELLLGGVPGGRWRERVIAGLGDKVALNADVARGVVIQVLASPAAQVG